MDKLQWESLLKVSIHTPVKARRTFRPVPVGIFVGFNPHAREGATGLIFYLIMSGGFQSTRP